MPAQREPVRATPPRVVRRDFPEVIELGGPGIEMPWGDDWQTEEVIALLEPMVQPARQERINRVLDARLSSVTILLDAPHDPHNGAAILRSADAFGVQCVHVVPREESFQASPNIAKGTERWVDVIRHTKPESAAEGLKAEGYQLVATHPEGRLRPADLRDLPKFALIMGNEHDGIRPEIEKHVDQTVQIPMVGFEESLYDSVSAAIMLHAGTLNRPGDLPDSLKRRLYARGLYRSINRGKEVLEGARAR